MISPIAIATRGRISSSKKRGLTLLSQGRIVTVEVQVIIITPTKPKQDYTVEYIAPGGGGYKSLLGKEYNNRLKQLEIIKRAKKDEEEILLIIKIFLECQ